MEKPKILSDEKIKDIQRECEVMQYVGLVERGIATAQLDADVAYYEQEEKEFVDSFTQTMREMVAQNRLEIQQAKAEVAREIFEEIEAYMQHETHYFSASGEWKERGWYSELKSKWGQK